MTSNANTRRTADFAILAIGLILAVIVVLNVGDVLTTALTLASGFFDSLTPAQAPIQQVTT